MNRLSTIDWGSMIGGSNQEHEFGTYPMDDEDIGVVSSSGEKNLRKKSSVKFDNNADGGCDEDYDLEDGQQNDEAEQNATRKRSSTCLVLTLLALFVGAIVCFVMLPPKYTAILNWKTRMPQQQQGRGQEMLELAEQITTACGKSSLTDGSSSCQELCHDHMCCVEEDDEYSCRNDETKDCAVYAGCEALIEDDLWLQMQD